MTFDAWETASKENPLFVLENVDWKLSPTKLSNIFVNYEEPRIPYTFQDLSSKFIHKVCQVLSEK